jgi:hypothetical protein
MASFDDMRTSMGQVIAWGLFAAIWGWLVFGAGHHPVWSIPAAVIGMLVLLIPVTLFAAVCWRFAEGMIELIRAARPPSPPRPTP